jgi:hypothetical protein
MRRSLYLAAAVLALTTASAFAEETEFKATLAGHAILPANTIIASPENAPEHLRSSGKFTTPDRKRAEGLGTVPGKDGVRPTGLSLPFDGQPVQGFSGIKAARRRRVPGADRQRLRRQGELARRHADACTALRPISRVARSSAPRPPSCTIPTRRRRSRIANEGTEKRYLTGADFDVESIQPVGGTGTGSARSSAPI